MGPFGNLTATSATFTESALVSSLESAKALTDGGLGRRRYTTQELVLMTISLGLIGSKRVLLEMTAYDRSAKFTNDVALFLVIPKTKFGSTDSAEGHTWCGPSPGYCTISER